MIRFTKRKSKEMCFFHRGTTWVREIVWLLRNHGDTSTADNIAVQHRCPCLEAQFVGLPPGFEVGIPERHLDA